MPKSRVNRKSGLPYLTETGRPERFFYAHLLGKRIQTQSSEIKVGDYIWLRGLCGNPLHKVENILNGELELAAFPYFMYNSEIFKKMKNSDRYLVVKKQDYDELSRKN